MARFVAGQGRAPWGDTVPSELGSKLAWTTRIPVGVVGMITPWNFPVAIPSWKCFPALLAGNGIVLKPSEHSPACAEAFVDACVEGGVPAGLIQIVHGHAEPGAAIATHPGIGAVSFTGSVPTGRKVAAAAMETGPASSASSSAARTPWSCATTPTSTSSSTAPSSVPSARPASAAPRRRGCSSTRPSPTRSSPASVERAAALRLGDPLDPGTDVGPGHQRRRRRTHRRHDRRGRRRGRRRRRGRPPPRRRRRAATAARSSSRRC